MTPSAPSASRRSFLALSGVGTAALVLGTGHPAAAEHAAPRLPADPFTLGVASGDPLPDGVVLWTRLAPEPYDGGGMPMANVEVAWEVAADRTFRTLVRKGTAIARPELGHSVHVEASGLDPGREYFY